MLQSWWEYIYEVVYCLLLLISSISCNSYYSGGSFVCDSYLQNFNFANYAWTVLQCLKHKQLCFISSLLQDDNSLYRWMKTLYPVALDFSIQIYFFSFLLKSSWLGICGRYIFWRVHWNKFISFSQIIYRRITIINHNCITYINVCGEFCYIS